MALHRVEKVGKEEGATLGPLLLIRSFWDQVA